MSFTVSIRVYFLVNKGDFDDLLSVSHQILDGEVLVSLHGYTHIVKLREDP